MKVFMVTDKSFLNAKLLMMKEEKGWKLQKS